MSIDPEIFRQAMRAWATGVTVVTSAHDGVRHGMTVSSFTSLSVTPPQVLVAISHNVRTHKLITNSGFFGVSILSSEQQAISDRFAGRIPDAQDRFDGLSTFEMVSGIPLLSAGMACVDCRVINTLNSGAHTIFVGEVLAARRLDAQNPLIYFDRDYRHLQK
jgi:flavin reductase (DIM6/NTAB) family NADH-FMN oxidoreductase RutF